ncbi:MAG TPA: sensor histidine kinase [Verrucomicrobiae bacterium]
MSKYATISGLLLFLFRICSAHAADSLEGHSNVLKIQSILVRGMPLDWHPGSPLTLDPSADDIQFRFGPGPDAARRTARLRFKLEKFDSDWRDGAGEMFVGVRYIDAAGRRLEPPTIFTVQGESKGWNGTLETSSLTHRRETVEVPPRAAQVEVIISSAGPPATIGFYAVEDLAVFKVLGDKSTKVLFRSSFAPPAKENQTNLMNQPYPGWIPDGIHPDMASFLELGKTPKTQALAILDDDPAGHAEWRSRREVDPQVAPGENLVVEWNELYSMGLGAISQGAHYDKLPSGDYRFRVQEADLYGRPTGVEAALTVTVPRPLWETPWAWALVTCIAVVASTASVRYVGRQRLRRTMLLLEQQRALEQERLRIAQDIHDDVGARVTQISLVSGLAQNDPTLSENARANFDRISRMSRELVSALYETVWAVNPENDALEELGNYLCQRINEFCAQAHLRCSLDVDELPADIAISSHARHNISLAVKEAVHNVIKHAGASQIAVQIRFVELLLTISVRDDGRGFETERVAEGNGWPNMKRRLADIGGSCVVESSPGKGTTVRLTVRVQPLDKAGNGKETAPAPDSPAEFESTEQTST